MTDREEELAVKVFELLSPLDKYKDCIISNTDCQSNVEFVYTEQIDGKWCKAGLVYVAPGDVLKLNGQTRAIAENWYAYAYILDCQLPLPPS